MKLFSKIFPLSNLKDYLGIDIDIEEPRYLLADYGKSLLLIGIKHTSKPMNGGQISFLVESDFAKLLLADDVIGQTYNDLFTGEERYNHIIFSSIFVKDNQMKIYLKHLSNEGSILYVPNFLQLAEEAETRYITKK